MITKAAAVELIKLAVIDPAAYRAMEAGVSALYNYARRRAGRNATESLLRQYRASDPAHTEFVRAALKELKPIKTRDGNRFFFGDIGGHEVYCDLANLKDIPRKRLAQIPGDHAGDLYRDMSPDEFLELLPMEFPDAPTNVLKGVSFDSRAFEQFKANLKKKYPNLSSEQIADRIKPEWEAIFKSGKKVLETNRDKFPDRLFNMYNTYKNTGVNDMFVSHPSIVTKSGHRPVLFSKPTSVPDELGNASELTTLYKLSPSEIAEATMSNRIVEPLKPFNPMA